MTQQSKTRSVLDICDRALDLDNAARETYLNEVCQDDSALRAAVDAVLSNLTLAERQLGDRADVPEPEVPDVIGGWRLGAALGEGGMGQVYLASRERDGVRQTAAVKIMRGRFFPPGMLERFLAEREILARLNHPYIAGMIDSGSEGGVPFLAMELIEGIAIDDWLNTRCASLDQRIDMIQKVAVAVHSAHQNLVVHRDLKPSNILVTEDGIPKLLDFGVAKLLDTAEAPPTDVTRYSGAALTPNYASPEQLLDNHATTLSDVYSLGVLAYELLLGRRPYDIDVKSQRRMVDSVATRSIAGFEEALHASDNLPRLAEQRGLTERQFFRSVRGDLETVLRKAMASDPNARYPSVAAFSEDLDRARHGQPVTARPPSLRYLLGRWIARNRLPAALAVALSFSLVGGLVFSSWSLQRTQEAREQADARFEEVRELAGTLMFELYDEVARVPGTVSAQTLLASTANQYIDQLAADPNAPEDVRLEALRGYARLYGILNRQAVKELRIRERAISVFEHAERVAEQLINNPSISSRAQLEIGKLRSRRGADLLAVDNDPDASRDMLIAALEAIDASTRDDRVLAEATAARLHVQQRQVNLLKWEERYADAVDAAQRVATEIETALAEFGDALGIERVAGELWQIRGEAHYWQDDYPAALKSYDTAIAYYERAASVGHDGADVSADLSVVHWSRANTLIDMSRPEDAAVDYGRAIDLIAPALARDPNDISTARRMAILRGSRAMALVQSGDTSAAIAEISKTNEWFEAQALAEPDTPMAQRSLAVSYYVTADIYRIAGESNAACGFFRESLNVWEAIDARFGISEFDSGQPPALREILRGCD